jgi:hypothetical protein
MGQACSAECSKGNAADEFDTAHAVSYSYSQQKETPVKNRHVHVAPSSSCCARQRLSSDDGLAPGDGIPEGYVFDIHADAINPPAVAEIERVPAEGIAFEEIMSRLYIPDHDRAKAPVDTRKRLSAEKAVAYAEDESIPDAEPQNELEPEETRDDVLQGIFSGRPLYSVPSYLRDDKDIVLAAIRMEGAFCSDYIESQFLRSEDRDVVLALVRADGSLLETASEDLRDDFEVVREAVRTSSGALRCASQRLQADRELKSLAAGQLKEEKRLTKLFADKCGSACAPPAACAPTRFWGR